LILTIFLWLVLRGYQIYVSIISYVLLFRIFAHMIARDKGLYCIVCLIIALAYSPNPLRFMY